MSALTYDLCVCLFAFLFANIIVHTSGWTVTVSSPGLKTLSFVAAGALSIFAMRLNRGVWRYASIPDIIAIVKAASIMVVLYMVGALLVTGSDDVSRLAMFLTWLFVIIGMGSGRIAYRVLKEAVLMPHLRSQTLSSNVLLYPLSDTTDAYIRTLRLLHTSERNVVGVVDRNPASSRRVLQGVPVIGNLRSLSKTVKVLEARGQSVSELIVTDPEVSGAEMAELLESCNEASLTIKRLASPLPGKDLQLDNPTITPNLVRLDDLLGRQEVPSDPVAMRAFLTGKCILITGAGGSIGSELAKQIAEFSPARLALLDSSEQNLYDIERVLRQEHPDLPIGQLLCDVRDVARVDTIMQRENPDIVFHAAAIKHVPIAEANPLEAVKTNVLGTVSVADAAVRAAVKAFVLISTDKAVNPSCIMGAAKRAAELYCQGLDITNSVTRFRIVRFGNVLGSAGSVVPLFQEQIAQGGPLTVTDPDMERYFMTVQEAVHLILEANSHGIDEGSQRGAVLVLEMGKPVRILELARRMIQLAGFIPGRDISIMFTGMRPGEKISEELLNANEDDIIQRRKGYFVARTRTVDWRTLNGWLSDLRHSCQEEDWHGVLQTLKTIVPSYTALDNGRVSEVASDNPDRFPVYSSRHLH
ncbi:nucleoside-diphosphate sugar epimerase/dehydratase [Pseudohoeflea suaedae]|uniref:nucleoside-diphosphate sugar epimerase/dehydratase n=1 Tax=Pseudohoeflea suaedae TaxID=877384 RepID=UPI001304F56F|nr:nucleoside-diphosphate sugar epimerase/dehydratase [Pseudohoeflea suaedae]